MKRELRRPDRTLIEEETEKVLDGAPFMTVSMNGCDGWPYAVALSFARIGKNLYFHSAQEGFKVDSLHLDSRVCISAVEKSEANSETFNVNYRSAVGFGAVRLVSDPEERYQGLLAICRKYAAGNPSIEKASRDCAGAHIYCIELQHLTGKFNFGK